MARTSPATADSVPQNQKGTLEEVLQMRGGSAARGPFSPMINVPEMAKRTLHLWHYLRGDGSNESSLSLPQKTQELAMIVVAREMDCQFIWNAHSAAGRGAGLSDALVDNLRDKKELTGMAPDESAVVTYGQEFFRTHRVSQASFDAAVAQFGVRGVAELTNLMGFYATLAFNANAFGMDLPEERTEPVLPI
ncbi:MAG: hypothetical protein BZY88_00510 [SAR202 cluster bacterium Io17-Chloro-G9]|nr:MAG: hypothetical protein BZY88_00510 [SAR202 cluster bacterium Io17-Chloro-G9]